MRWVVLLLFALWWTPALAEAQPLSPEEGRLVDLRFACDLPDCSDDRFRSRILGLTALAPGVRVSRAQLDRAYASILETSYFASCTPEETWSGDEVSVAISCAGATIIRDVAVRAGTALGSEIRRRVFLRSGQPWDPADTDRIGRQVQEINRYFEERGYFGTTVDIEVEAVGPFLVDLTFHIDRGRRAAVDQVYVRGASVLTYDEVRDVVLGEFNLVRTFTADRFGRAQDALVSAYRERGYIQARVSLDEFRVDERTGTVDLFLEIREGTRWDVRFVGNRLFSRDQLLDALTFYQTGFVDDAEIAVAIRQLRSLYETVGHVFAEITVSQPITTDGSRALYFRIQEQSPSEIRAVEFVGLTVFTPELLRARIETTPYDILAAGGYLQRSRLDNDVRTIIELYRSVGYPDATVPRVSLVGENNGRDLYVTIHVDEGRRTSLVDLEVSGIPDTDAVALEAEILRRRRQESRARAEGMPPTRDVYDNASVLADQAVALEFVQQQGFPNASVTAACFAATDDGFGDEVACPSAGMGLSADLLSLAQDAAQACQRDRRGGRLVEECRLSIPPPVASPAPRPSLRRIAVRYEVERGGTVRLADWFVRGNFTTRPRIMERELQLQRGDIFRYHDLLEAQSRLRATRLFDSVRVQTIAEGEERDEAFLVVQVEERAARSIEHRISLSARIATADQLLLVLSNAPTFRDVNVFGSGSELRVFGNFDFDVIDTQRLGEGVFRGAAGVAYLDPRLYLSRRMRDPWEWVNSLTYSYDLLALPPAPLEKEIAFRTAVREEFDAIPGLFIGAELAVRRTATIDQSDTAAIGGSFDPALIFSLTPRITYEGRDNPLNPARGVFGELEIELADDFIGVLNSARYTRVESRLAGFVPLGRERFVLGMNGRFGFAVGGLLDGFQSSSSFALPVSERFRLGGVTTLRGFAEGEIPSTGVDSFGGDVVLGSTVELRYPFLRNASVDGAVFVDVGQLARDFDELRLDSFRTSAGFGLRWLIADLIPLVFDYGAVLNRRSGERFGRFHLNIGYTF